MAARYVVFEGIDGAGKTTLIRGVRGALEARGIPVVVTKEPTDGPIGRRIRELATRGRGTVSPEEELALFHEDRRIHVAEVVRPALVAGKTVLQDRSFYSTVAYQGDRGLDRAAILARSLEIAELPGLLLVVDLPAELALERLRQGRGVTDDFESLSSLRRVRAVFQSFTESGGPPPSHLLDGCLPENMLLSSALALIDGTSTPE
ncbi:MAG: dTMP kinase [Deltaproteobacteria bacterium]|nr:dTMP kinase [Deltaproteobacteria bacterium]